MADIQIVKRKIAQSGEVFDLPIYQEDGTPYLAADGKTPSTIGIVGEDSEHYRTAQAEVSRKTQRLPRLDRAKINWRVVVAACAVARWSGWEADGKPWPCTRENIESLLSSTHILEQVENAIKDHAGFFVTPSTS